MNRIYTLRSAVISEAVAICRGKKMGSLADPNIAHLRGVLALERGHSGLALMYLTLAIGRAPRCSEVYADLGDVYFRRSRRAEALAAHLQAVRLSWGNCKALSKLGGMLRCLGRLIEAQAVFQEALRLDPADYDTRLALADVLLMRKRFSEAIEEYRAAVGLRPHGHEAYQGLARAFLQTGSLTEAVRHARKALACAPDSVQAHVTLSGALVGMRQYEEASSLLEKALNLGGVDVIVCRQYVLVLELLGRGRDAFGAWIGLGDVLQARQQFEEAIVAYREALVRQPHAIRALIPLARALEGAGRFDDAEVSIRSAIENDPEHGDAHLLLGELLQRRGQWTAAWPELAWFYHPQGRNWRHIGEPVWTGESLAGRTILLWATDELSDSDTIQYLRYAWVAKTLGARVVVQCHQHITTLARHALGVDEVIATGGPLPRYDMHAPLYWLPSVVRSIRDVKVTIPYLTVAEQVREAWRKRLAPGEAPLIGIAWAAAFADREQRETACSLREFRQLAGRSAGRFISLQQGPFRDELRAYPGHASNVEAHLDESSPLVELSGLVANLGLVITVDERVAHLAAAMGKPVWLLLPYASGLPWPADGNRTPWYQTLRIFRQSIRNDWRDVINDTVKALEDVTVERLT